MIAWDRRPVETASLFNPAFCSLLLRQSISGYALERSDGMTYILAFLVLPIVLHRFTREQLPSKISTKMHAWLNSQGEVKVQFPERVRAINPYTREGLTYGLQSNLFSIDENGKLLPISRKIKMPWKLQSESSSCSQKAEFVGRWLAQAGEPGTIYHMWGIRP